MLSLLVGKYLGMAWLGPMAIICFSFLKNCQTVFPQWLYHFAPSSVLYGSSRLPLLATPRMVSSFSLSPCNTRCVSQFKLHWELP